MAILNHDTYNYNGIQLKDIYICISDNSVNIKINKFNGVSLYNIQINYCIYASLEAKNNNMRPLIYNCLTHDLSSAPDNNIYTYAYDQLKLLYPNYSDC